MCQLSYIALALILLGGCSDSSDTPPDSSGTTAKGAAGNDANQSSIRLRDVTAESGLQFSYRNGDAAGHFSIVESLGGGIGLGDFDGDHLLDVFLPGGGRFSGQRQIDGLPSACYLNRGHLTFQNATQLAGVGASLKYSHGANVGDFDNDGFSDVLVTGYGGLTLWQNRGDGTFEDVTRTTGLIDPQWSSSSAWADFNGDGHLDLYVAHYVNWSWENHPTCLFGSQGDKEVCPPRRFDPLPHVLCLGEGDGTFREASHDWGLRPDGKGLGVVVGDVDLDGRVDVYVGNDTVPNFLYRNLGDRFEEIGLSSGTALSDKGTPDGSMGVDIGDFDEDGQPDIWVSNYESENFALYRNQGQRLFLHVSQPLGVTAIGGLFVGWGCAFVDFDRDSDLDVFCLNGHVIRHPVNAPLQQLPVVLENQARKRFANVAESVGDFTRTPHMGRGCAVGDLDNDGDWDVVASSTNEPVSVLSNESVAKGHWLAVRLVGRRSSREAIGAIARLKFASGRQLLAQIKSGGSYASTSDRRLFWGLDAAEQAESLHIRWPAGAEQTLPINAVDREMTVLEPD